MDSFYEQLVKSEKSSSYNLVNGLTYVFGAIALLSLSSNIIFLVLFGLLAGACFYFKRKMFVEYEYDFTNGEMDIDVIYEKKRRKRIMTINAKDIELLAEEKTNYVADFANKPQKEMNLYPKGVSSKVYVAMVTGGTERLQLRFVPDERLLELIYKFNPRAVKK